MTIAAPHPHAPAPVAVIPGLVSTIIPVFNRAALLVEAVDSVLAQSYRPIEVVIVDDGSNDITPECAQTLRERHPELIRVIHQANAGPGAARQRGLDQAQGEFIQFLDSDDLLLPNKFEAQVAALHAHAEAQICYGPSIQEDHSSQPPHLERPMRATGSPHPYLFPMLLLERWWTTSCPLYRRALLDRIGPWQPWINEEDWEYDARAGATGAPLAWVNEEVSIRRIHLNDDHLSSDGHCDPRKLSHRASAQISLYRCAHDAGVNPRAPEMQQFARSAFLLCRQCGSAGLAEESRQLFELARKASRARKRHHPEFRVYALLASLLGWCRAARLTVALRAMVMRP